MTTLIRLVLDDKGVIETVHHEGVMSGERLDVYIRLPDEAVALMSRSSGCEDGISYTEDSDCLVCNTDIIHYYIDSD